MIEKLKSEEPGRLWLAVPEVIDWADIKEIKYGSSKKAKPYTDVYLYALKQELGEKLASVSTEHLKKNDIVCMSESTDSVKYGWRIYKCIYCELEKGNHTFILSSGVWYQVQNEFVKQVRNDYGNIPIKDLNWPKYDENEAVTSGEKADEKWYNRKISVEKNLAFMDEASKQIPYGGGRSKIEFCDLYDGNQRWIIHIKRYSGSQVLSHLFLQGFVSAELFLLDETFRKAVNEKLPVSHKIQDVSNPIGRKEYTLIYGIISASKADLDLPFFSKVSLRNIYRRLIGFGYEVFLAKIGYVKKSEERPSEELSTVG